MTAERDHARARESRIWVAGGWSVAGVCVAVSAVTIAWQFSVRGMLSNQDSWFPMRAALDLSATGAGERLYETLFFQQHVKMQYPPTSLLPLELLDAMGAGGPLMLNGLNIMLTLVNAALLAALADATSRPLLLPGVARAGIAIFAATAGLAFYPIVRGLQLGQIQVWLDLCATAACLLLVYGRPATAGLVIGFASLIKPQFAPLLLLGLLARQWRFAAGFAGMAGLLGLVSLCRYGLHNHVAYLAVLCFIGQHGEAFYANNSVNGIMNRLLGNGGNLVWSTDSFAPFHPAVFVATTAAALAFMAVPMLAASLMPGRERAWPPARVGQPGSCQPAFALLFGLGLLCFVLASPVAWEHHYGVLPPLFILAASRVALMPPQGRRPGLTATLVAAWLLSACKLDDLTRPLSGTVANPLQATCFLGALLLMVVVTYLVLDRTTEAPVSAMPQFPVATCKL